MAAGAARHGARTGTRGLTSILQALGVAGGGLLAVSVMTMLAGGPAPPDLDPAEVSTSTSRSTGLPAGSRSTDGPPPGGGGASPGSARVPSPPGVVAPRGQPAPPVQGAGGAGGPSSPPTSAPTPSPTRSPHERGVPVTPSHHPVTPTPRPAPSATPTVPTPVDTGVPAPADGAEPGAPPSG